MKHFGLIKLESSNLLDITICGYKVIKIILYWIYIVLQYITNLQNLVYIVGCKIVIKGCRSKKFWDLLLYKIHRILARRT